MPDTLERPDSLEITDLNQSLDEELVCSNEKCGNKATHWVWHDPGLHCRTAYCWPCIQAWIDSVSVNRKLLARFPSLFERVLGIQHECIDCHMTLSTEQVHWGPM